MSTTSIQFPANYGFCILGSVVVPMIASTYMGGQVMEARKKCNVHYPNLYATPGFHKQADEFNRVQRGHQNFFEGFTTFTVASLLGGFKYPLANAVYGVLFSLGSILYQVGYGDTKLDVKMARYKKGGGIKWIGFFGALGSCISLAGSIQGWW